MPPDGLIKPGNIDLNPRSAARHVRLETDQGVFLVPAVGDDGRELSRQEAIELFKKTGKHLGQFKTTEAADQYSQVLQKQAADGPGGKLKRTLSDYAVSEGKAVREAGSTVGRTLRGYGKAIKDRPIAPVREKDVEIPDVVGEMAKGVIDPVKKAATEAGGELHRAYSQGLSPCTMEDVRDSSFHIAQPAPQTLANPANLTHAQQLAAEYDDTGTIVSTTGVRPRVPSYQQGTDYVPETGLAVVHEGEKIVPRQANSAAEGAIFSKEPLSIPEFAQKIKQREPRLASVPDDELVRKTLERRPDLLKYIRTAEPRPRAREKTLAERGLETLPYVGATIGGLAASPGIVTSVGGAALGGAAGEAAEPLGEKFLTKTRPVGTSGEAAAEIGWEFVKQGAYELGGRAIAAVGGRAITRVLVKKAP